LSSIFRVLPKNDRGTVSAATARYAIHRVFLERHGWQVKGMTAGGQVWSSASPVSALGSGPVRDIFEERLGARGFGQRDLAVLAATLESLIHSEVAERLEAVYKALGKPLDRKLDKSSVLDIIDAYMASWLAGDDLSNMSRADAVELRDTMGQWFTGWAQIQGFVRSTLRENSAKLITMAFSDVTRIVEAVSEGFDHTAYPQCNLLQDRLLELEDGNGTGRVRLSEFHASTVRKGYWWFRETADYLRRVGALDESNSSVPRVIIPNYIHTPHNCIVSAKYYAVCCADACENMMAHLEGKVRAPHASPEVIADVVSEWLSTSAKPSRNLSAALISKLNDIAEQNGGAVPLHGRLLAQWMHFVNPRECPYPHVSNTTSYEDKHEYTRRTGQAHAYTRKELYATFGEGASPEVAVETGASGSADSDAAASVGSMCSEEDLVCSAMWEPVEELVDPVHGQVKLVERRQASFRRTCFRVLGMVTVVGSMCAILKDSLLSIFTVSSQGTKAGTPSRVFV